MSNINTVLRSVGGKVTGNPLEYVLDCWLCGGVQKLYFNTKKGIGYCQKCGKPISMQALLKEAGGLLNLSKESIQELLRESRDQEVHNTGLKDYLAQKLFGGRPLSTGVEDLPEALLPPGFFLLETGHEVPGRDKALNYLLGRGFSKSTLFTQQFGFCDGGHYHGRVIIPFWENNKIVYWQARDYTGRQKPKILNPFKNFCQVGKSEVLFNYDGVRDKDIVVVTESWGSALAVGSHAVGINGKDLSATQLRKLLHLPARMFLVLLDHGAELKAAEAAASLSEHRTTLLARLPWGDPNEVPKALLNQVIANAEEYSTMSKLRSATATLRLLSNDKS